MYILLDYDEKVFPLCLFPEEKARMIEECIDTNKPNPNIYEIHTRHYTCIIIIIKIH